MPSEIIAALDDGLARAGEDVILRRVIGYGTNTQNIDVKVRASVRDAAAGELIAGLMERQRTVIISPTPLIAAQWPGGQAPQLPPYDEPPFMPRKDDKLIIQGRLCNVGKPPRSFKVGDAIVRIEMLAVG